jgi:hypothetical protein
MAGSRMKDYVRRQLRYWVDDFKDDMLPRDFMAKSFAKTQLMLPHVGKKNNLTRRLEAGWTHGLLPLRVQISSRIELLLRCICRLRC